MINRIKKSEKEKVVAISSFLTIKFAGMAMPRAQTQKVAVLTVRGVTLKLRFCGFTLKHLEIR